MNKRLSQKLSMLCRTVLVVLLCMANLQATADYNELQTLFREWRAFERPPMLNGAPDYTADTFAERYETFQVYKKRLQAIDYTSWPVDQKADWYVLLAEMNGFDFNQRILKPWVRDPAFYKSLWTEQSDVPAHEGPTHHSVTELWTYSFPLSKAAEARLINDLKIIAPLNQQAQKNLTGNARDLWIAGIRDIRQQSSDLQNLQNKLAGQAGEKLKQVIGDAKNSSDNFVVWLEQQASKKTGPSGLGKENYSWYQQNVHLLPLSWEDEVRLLERELARAWSSLKLEEQRNRDLPQLSAAATAEEFNTLAEHSADHLLNFLKEQEIITVPAYFAPALKKQIHPFVPAEKRNFFTICSHHDPTPLFSHFFHWFVLARMEQEPHPNPIRREAMLYNIFDTRDEGLATAVEEMLMHAGLYDNNPRGREIVWIMLAQRAARGLGSLYAHANQMTMTEAGKVHSEWTPRGWMQSKQELLIFEQHLYLRQPGYGTSYITGKYMLEKLMAEYARQKEVQGAPFVLKDFMDEFLAVGSIPTALGHWQMTGDDDPLRMIIKK